MCVHVYSSKTLRISLNDGMQSILSYFFYMMLGKGPTFLFQVPVLSFPDSLVKETLLPLSEWVGNLVGNQLADKGKLLSGLLIPCPLINMSVLRLA